MKINIQSLDLNSKSNEELIELGKKYNNTQLWMAIHKLDKLTDEEIIEVLHLKSSGVECIWKIAFSNISYPRKHISKLVSACKKHKYNFIKYFFKSSKLTEEEKIKLAKKTNNYYVWIRMFQNMEFLKESSVRKVAWFGKKNKFVKDKHQARAIFSKLLNDMKWYLPKKTLMTILKINERFESSIPADNSTVSDVTRQLENKLEKYNCFDNTPTEVIWEIWQKTKSEKFLNLAEARSATYGTKKLIDFARKNGEDKFIWRELLRLKKLKWKEI